ncbi:MAG: tyrosine-type recombinase/integrase [Syntrophomonadaceae bacterium]|nr:tyrosine-type recombinase/integrase [Syntrophomonadaceae bacterium]
MRIHDIRHSVVTILLTEEVPAITVASLVGHDVSTTVSKYAQQIRTG